MDRIKLGLLLFSSKPYLFTLFARPQRPLQNGTFKQVSCGCERELALTSVVFASICTGILGYQLWTSTGFELHPRPPIPVEARSEGREWQLVAGRKLGRQR